MSRALRIVWLALFPAVIALTSLALQARAVAGPCPPGDFGC